jgi:hypothetical protein
MRTMLYTIILGTGGVIRRYNLDFDQRKEYQ